MDALIIAIQKGRLGTLTLNRPKALNAIDGVLQQQIISQLKKWETDPVVQVVILNSSSIKAFCAGGDIRQIHSCLLQGHYEDALAIFQHNYELVAYVSQYPKPIISIMNGITMGGGIGLGAFVPYRIVTERSLLAMPEVMIGLTPDAGSNFLFAKAPGYTGLRMMLTGKRFQAEEAVKLGFADYIVPSSDLDALLFQLKSSTIEGTLSCYQSSERYDPSFLQEVDHIYGASSIEAIILNLQQSKFAWAKEDLQAILEACPFSLRISYQAWHQKLHSLSDILQRDLKLISHLIIRKDFLEGVRASVIDKDRCPKWDKDPIDPKAVQDCFVSVYHKDR